MYNYAITRKPCRNFFKGLTTSDLGIPDYQKMIRQHNSYVELLISMGLKVRELEPLNEFPDAHFVEDTAVVVPEIAIITNPGAKSRKGEEISIEKELIKYKRIKKIKEPGTLDGGDILIVGNIVLIGLSERTNEEGSKQLSELLLQYGYQSKFIEVKDGLHLKSELNFIGNGTLLLTEKYTNHPDLDIFSKIIVDQDEKYAANSLLINDKVLIPSGFPRTKEKMQSLDFDILELDMSESQKMDGGLTCLSLRF